MWKGIAIQLRSFILTSKGTKQNFRKLNFIIATRGSNIHTNVQANMQRWLGKPNYNANVMTMQGYVLAGYDKVSDDGFNSVCNKNMM